MRAKRAKKGQNLIIFWGALVFPREFAIPQQGKSKETFENRGQKVGKLWASVGACIRLDWGLYRALWGVLEGFRPDSPAYLQIRAFWLSLCNRFPSLLPNFRFKGILRGFIWVYMLWMCIRLVRGFRGACVALCV